MFKLIFSALGLAVAFGVFFMYTQPTYQTVQAKKAEIAQYDEALDRAAELQQLKQSLLSRYNAFNPADLARLQKLLPDHVDNVRLVLDLDNLAGAHGMALQNVLISNPASETGDNSVVGAIGAARQKFDSLTLQFSTVATYPVFVQFLENLESSLRIVDLVSLSLQPEDADDTGEPLYSFDITIRTYWLK
ncbi:hypothetical protein C4556_02365 [Candidatus Parcubacteria bacterium]|nr:MAG: hypothetical protein C4556_02365 [Candidatus Parcubacteria bacterium]